MIDSDGHGWMVLHNQFNMSHTGQSEEFHGGKFLRLWFGQRLHAASSDHGERCQDWVTVMVVLLLLLLEHQYVHIMTQGF